MADEIVEAELNGRALDLAEAYDGARLTLDGLAADNKLRVVAHCRYMHTGEGLHRFVDPVDKSVYLYTQFEVADSRRMFTVFEQPDLKATFAFTVTAPDDWQVVSNQPTPEPERLDLGTGPLALRAHGAHLVVHHGAWSPGPTTASTASTATATASIPLALYCRASLAEHLDSDVIFDETRAGLRVLRAGLRHALPVREVRPAVRAGVQLGRDGERRLRDPQRGLRLPVAGARRCPTSGAR